MDNIPEMGDEADAPIIVPPPGQILRRTARTKIRKAGLPGDGGGHRFGASRKGSTKPVSTTEQSSSSDLSTSDHHSELDATPRPTVDNGPHQISRPDSFSEEASIYDAYARDDEGDLRLAPVLVTSPLQTAEESLPLFANDVHQILPEVIPQRDPVAPIVQQPQPQRVLVLPPVPVQSPFPAPGPSPSAPVREHPPIAHSPPIPFGTTPSPPSQARKEKDKKGLFGKWGGDKGGKKGSKVKDRETAEKEKEAGFFGSLFGKKKQDSEYASSITSSTSGREAAHALLGASKSSKAYVPSTSPGLAPGIGGNPYARYPIHVERAIYRLSHIKLANPRRPLYEQVLISNLMFWYLGVINKAQNPTSPTQPAPTVGGASSEHPDDKDTAEKEREQREKEQRENAEKERLESERLEKEQRERELELKKKESGRRGSLTKANAGAPLGGRHAETPVKGPQYEMQHRVMEQEYGPYNGQPRGSPPLVNGPLAQQYSRSTPPPQYGNTGQQPHKAQQDPYYYQPPRPENIPKRPILPPGAMAPVDQSSWMPPPSSPNRRRPSPNPLDPGQRRSSSPPPHFQQGQETLLMQLPKLNNSQESIGDRNGPRNSNRSLSTTAPSPPPALPFTNGQIRKGRSANAIIFHEQRPYSEERPLTSPTSGGEEEDLPLAAVWQRRRM